MEPARNFPPEPGEISLKDMIERALELRDEARWVLAAERRAREADADRRGINDKQNSVRPQAEEVSASVIPASYPNTQGIEGFGEVSTANTPEYEEFLRGLACEWRIPWSAYEREVKKYGMAPMRGQCPKPASEYDPPSEPAEPVPARPQPERIPDLPPRPAPLRPAPGSIPLPRTRRFP